MTGSGDRLTLELAAEDALLQRLNGAIQALQDPQDLLRSIGAVMESNVNRRFDTKRDPSGKPWPPISEFTPLIAAKINKTLRTDDNGDLVVPPLPGTLLERTRRMRDSLESHVGTGFVDWGFGVPYAIYHETGTKRKGQPYMPRRGLLTANPETGQLGSEDREDIQAEIEHWLRELLG